MQCTTSTSTDAPGGRTSQFGEAMNSADDTRPVSLFSIKSNYPAGNVLPRNQQAMASMRNH